MIDDNTESRARQNNSDSDGQLRQKLLSRKSLNTQQTGYSPRAVKTDYNAEGRVE